MSVCSPITRPSGLARKAVDVRSPATRRIYAPHRPGWTWDEVGNTGIGALSSKPNPGGHFIVIDRCQPELSVDATVARISALQGLALTSTVGASLGGASGKRIDVSASQRVIFCSTTSAPPVESFFDPGDRGHIYVLNVSGATVLVTVLAPQSDFDAFLPQAQPVLDSLKWGW